MKFKRSLALLLLAALLLIPCFDFAVVYAQNSPNPYNEEGFTYVCFGDSYTRGMGCSDTWEKDTELDYSGYMHQSRNVPGAYPYLVAQALGCDTETANGYLDEPEATYWPLIQNGQTVAGVLDGLGVEDGYYDSLFYHNPDRGHARRYNKMVMYFGNPDSVYPTEGETYGEYGEIYDARDLINQADMITVQLGMADVFNRPVFAAAQEWLGHASLDFDDADTDDIVKFAAAVVRNMYDGYEYFIKGYPLLVEYLKNQNEDGTVVLLSMANPAFGINITDEVLLPIGNAFSVISVLVNQHIKETAEKYGAVYVDISNVDTASNENDWSLEDIMDGTGKDEIGTHPSPNGHKQIARMILDAYQNQDKQVTEDITIDLGRFDSVDYVMLDNQILSKSKYSVEDNVLTVKSSSKQHKTLTIAVKKGDDLAVSVYQLTYHKDSGYSAYRIYTTNSVDNIGKSIWNPIKSVGEWIINGIKDLINPDPGTEPDDPGTKPDDPGTEPDDPGTKPEDDPGADTKKKIEDITGSIADITKLTIDVAAILIKPEDIIPDLDTAAVTDATKSLIDLTKSFTDSAVNRLISFTGSIFKKK